jgi:hypothetical protein
LIRRTGAKQGDYSADETDFTNLSLDEFYAVMDAVFFSAADIPAKVCYIAVIVGPSQREAEIFDHAHGSGTPYYLVPKDGFRLRDFDEFVRTKLLPYLESGEYTGDLDESFLYS